MIRKDSYYQAPQQLIVGPFKYDGTTEPTSDPIKLIPSQYLLNHNTTNEIYYKCKIVMFIQ